MTSSSAPDSIARPVSVNRRRLSCRSMNSGVFAIRFQSCAALARARPLDAWAAPRVWPIGRLVWTCVLPSLDGGR